MNNCQNKNIFTSEECKGITALTQAHFQDAAPKNENTAPSTSKPSQDYIAPRNNIFITLKNPR